MDVSAMARARLDQQLSALNDLPAGAYVTIQTHEDSQDPRTPMAIQLDRIEAKLDELLARER